MIRKIIVSVLVIGTTAFFCVFMATLVNDDQRCKFKINLTDKTVIVAKKCYSTDGGFLKVVDCDGRFVILPREVVASVEEVKRVYK